jgi:hypothetical protein
LPTIVNVPLTGALLHHPIASQGIYHTQLIQLVAIGLLVHVSGGALTVEPPEPSFGFLEIHLTSVVGQG